MFSPDGRSGRALLTIPTAEVRSFRPAVEARTRIPAGVCGATTTQSRNKNSRRRRQKIETDGYGRRRRAVVESGENKYETFLLRFKRINCVRACVSAKNNRKQSFNGSLCLLCAEVLSCARGRKVHGTLQIGPIVFGALTKFRVDSSTRRANFPIFIYERSAPSERVRGSL